MTIADAERDMQFLWSLLQRSATPAGERARTIQLDLRADCNPLGARAGDNVVSVDRGIMRNLYELSVANTILHAYRPPGIDARTAVDSFSRTLALSQARVVPGQPCPAVPTIFDVLGKVVDAERTDSDPEFWRLVAVNWRQSMIFVLAHEIGHIILDHDKSSQSLALKETEANIFAIRTVNSMHNGMAQAGAVVMSFILYVLYDRWLRAGDGIPNPSPAALENFRRLCIDTVTIIARLQGEDAMLLKGQDDGNFAKLADELAANLDPIVQDGRRQCLEVK